VEEPLFISNSEAIPDAETRAGGAVLRTVGFVLLAIVLCEVALRATGWPRAIPYELGGEEYNAVAAALNRDDAPEILVVGSSRAREAINLPLLKQVLSERAGRDVSVGSCAVSGAHTSDVEAIVSRALRTKNPPKYILYGIAERDINRTGGAFDQATRFWNLDDLRGVMAAHGAGKILPELATVARNEIGRHFRLLGMREQIRLTVRQKLTGTHRDAKETLIYGQLTDWQKGSPRRSLQTKPAPRERVLQNIRDFQRREYPDVNLIACLERTIARFGNGKTELILFEVPPSRAVRKALPPNVYPSFLQTVDEQTKGKPDVQFFTTNRLALDLGDRDFREMAHLNLNGATKMTQALVDAIYPAKKKKKPATTPTTQPQ
jgi:hypothetical protein